MGLLSSAKKSIGRVKNKAATALSGISKGKIGGMASKVAGKTSVGMVASAVITSDKIAKKTGLPIGPFGLLRTGQKIKSKLPSIPSTAKKVAKGVAVTAAVAGGLYGIEKIAEKLGVRGGAGFIGRRKRRKSKSKYLTIRVRRNRRGKGKISRTEENRLRSLAKTYSYSEGTSRRSRRKKSKRNMKNYMRWVRSHRRKR